MKPVPPPAYFTGQGSDSDTWKNQPVTPYQQIPAPPPAVQQQDLGGKQSPESQVQASSVSSFHVYKAPGMFTKDDIITGDDKKQVL